MLFSRNDVAAFIDDYFEPVWQSVRPVPIVKIDFGNGKELVRTLNGNIATYVCFSSGAIVDILPGIYEANTYVDQLKQIAHEHYMLAKTPSSLLPGLISEYHTRQLKSPHSVTTAFAALADVKATARTAKGGPGSAIANLDGKLLSQDTHLNETERRRQIHQLLARLGPTHPQAITKKLYRDVLHADLDDPYLGLGPVLFGTYPFKEDLVKEDKGIDDLAMARSTPSLP